MMDSLSNSPPPQPDDVTKNVNLPPTSEVQKITELNERLAKGEHLYGPGGLAKDINKATRNEKIVVFDLDGVLKAEDGNVINPEAQRVLQNLKAAGYMIAVWSSGKRENFDTTPEVQGLPIDLVICWENYQVRNKGEDLEEEFRKAAIAYSKSDINLKIPASELPGEYFTNRQYKYPDMLFDRAVMVDNTNATPAFGVLEETIDESVPPYQTFIFDKRHNRTYAVVATPTFYSDEELYGSSSQPLEKIEEIVASVFDGT